MVTSHTLETYHGYQFEASPKYKVASAHRDPWLPSTISVFQFSRSGLFSRAVLTGSNQFRHRLILQITALIFYSNFENGLCLNLTEQLLFIELLSKLLYV